MKCTHFTTAFLISVAVFLAGCNKPVDRFDQEWTQPIAVSSSVAGLSGGVDLYKRQDTVIGLNPSRDGSAQGLFLNGEHRSWSEPLVINVPKGYVWVAAVDSDSYRILLPQSYAENEQLVMKVLIGTMTEKEGLRDITEKSWVTDKKTLLGETGPKVKLNGYSKRERSGVGSGILNGSEVLVPYWLQAKTFGEGNHVSDGPFNNGVFHSVDSGQTWRMEKISDSDARYTTVCRTAEYYYYFAGVYPLWFSRKASESAKWEEPQIITKTFAAGTGGYYAVAGEGDTVHICWMDRRHNKWRFNLDGPTIENNDIFYRRRKDSDMDWSKEVHLSKGSLYSYAPTISAEGDKVVVAWAGIRTADKQHTYLAPNDIYYATSKDGGKTWTEPLKVTDGAKDGVTAGMPQVALLNGTIHLLYTQGKRAKATELSPGLTKLGGEPWPIYYTQRPFPK